MSEEVRMEETHSLEEQVAEKRPRTKKSDTETEAKGEAMIQEGTHSQHLSHMLGQGGYF